jgi:uncharacterized membrane protein YccF (DUF307 family)
VIDVSLILVILVQYIQRHTMINHCDRRITHLVDTDTVWFIMVCFWMYCISITKMSDTSITVIYHGMSLNVLYQYHQDEWYIYHSDLSWYVSECTVSVSLRWVIHLSQWFIMVCFWMYCTSITKMSDTSITVIYHGMFLNVLYQYH